MPRLVYLSGVGLALVALAFVLTHWSLGSWPGVTEANAKRIREGMTLEEVKAILGPHPDDDNPLTMPVLRRARHLGAGKLLGLTWKGPSGDVVVWVSNDNRVDSAEWLSRSPESSPPTRLRAWLGW